MQASYASLKARDQARGFTRRDVEFRKFAPIVQMHESTPKHDAPAAQRPAPQIREIDRIKRVSGRQTQSLNLGVAERFGRHRERKFRLRAPGKFAQLKRHRIGRQQNLLCKDLSGSDLQPNRIFTFNFLDSGVFENHCATAFSSAGKAAH